MEHQPIACPRSYSAFISYSHDDRRFAARLGARLERYRLPRQIARRVGFRRLRPVFRDREELVAAPDVAEAIRAAILQADYLIVVCTPHAACSEWVAREIEMFREVHGDDRILTALFADPHPGCFPSVLFKRSDGAAIQPLAANFARDGDGARLALLKLVAVLAGVPLDDLVRRDSQRQLRLVIAIGCGILLLIAVLAGAAVLALRARAEAARASLRASEAVQSQLNLAPEVRSGASLRVASALVAGVERQLAHAPGGRDSVKHALQSAQALQMKAEIDEKKGDLTAARAEAQAAQRITAILYARDPANWDIVFAHAQSAYWSGFAAWRSGDVLSAEHSFLDYARLAQKLIRLDPARWEALRELGYADSNLGMLVLREAHDWPRARRDFAAAQTAFTAVVKRRRGDPDALDDAADGEAWLADVERLSGNYPSALYHRGLQRQLLQRLLQIDPSNAVYRVTLFSNQLGLARIAAAEGDHQAAARQFETALRTITELQSADTENISVARERRAATLFTVSNMLDIDPRHRPSFAAMEHGLGDCSRDWRIPSGEELAVLCSLLQARLELAQRRPAVARLILADPRVVKALASPTLTPHWMLDFTQESRGVRQALALNP